MQYVSTAGFGMLNFLNAVLAYCDIYQEVKPKKDKVEELEREYNEVSQF
jgi:dynein heavy chain, axonemal